MVHPTCSGINHPHPPEHLSSVNLSSDSQEHTEARSFDKGALDSGTRDVSQSSRVQISCQRSPLEDFPERIGLYIFHAKKKKKSDIKKKKNGSYL